MPKKIVLVLFSLMFLVVATAPVFAEEELFDTKGGTAKIEKGLSLLHSKKLDAAIEQFEDAAAAAPELEAEAYYYLGYAYYLKGRAGDAESRAKSKEYFDQAYEANPNFTPSKFKPTEPIPAPALQPQEKVVESPTITKPETPASAQPNDSQPKPAEPVKP